MSLSSMAYKDILFFLLLLLSACVLSGRKRSCCRVVCPSLQLACGDNCDESPTSCILRTKDGGYATDGNCKVEKDSYGETTEEECLYLDPLNQFNAGDLPFKLLAFCGLEDEQQFVGLDLLYPHSQFTQLEYSIKGDTDTRVRCVKVVKAQKITESDFSDDCHEGLNVTSEAYELRLCATGEGGRRCGQFVFTLPTPQELAKDDFEVELHKMEKGFDFILIWNIVLGLATVSILVTLCAYCIKRKLQSVRGMNEEELEGFEESCNRSPLKTKLL